MKQQDFFAELKELLETENELSADTDLKDLDEYDSLAIMGLVAFADQKLGRRISAAAFNNVTTVDSLMDVLGRENFD